MSSIVEQLSRIGHVDALEWAVMVTAAARGADLSRLARGMRAKLLDDRAWSGLAERAGVAAPSADVRELVVERIEAAARKAERKAAET